MMKSKFMKKVILDDALRANVKALCSVSDEVQSIIIGWYKNLDEYPRYDQKTIDTLSDATDTSHQTIRLILSLTDGLLTDSYKYNDNIEDIINDLKELELIPNEGDYNKLIKYFRELKSIIPEYCRFEKTKIAQKKGLPHISKTSMNVAVKPVFDRDFKHGEDDLKDFDQGIIDFTAATTVRLSLTNDQDISFQMDPYSLNVFITELLVLQDQLGKALKTINKFKRD